MSQLHVVAMLAGTDRGRSGLGTWVRCVLPRLSRLLSDTHGRITVVGTRSDLDAYPEINAQQVELPDIFNRPVASALWHLTRASTLARSAGADVLLLCAANRRLVVSLGNAVPTVAVVHDLAALHVNEKFDRARMFYNRRVVPSAVATAREIVAVSEATARDLREVLPKASKVRVVLNGVDASRFTPKSSTDPDLCAVRTRLRLKSPYILYPSRLEHPGKNHIRLFEAFARSFESRDRLLVLAGRDWGAESLLRARAEKLGISDRVCFAGYVSDTELPALVAGADLVAVVGLWEGFGLPALEALAAGRPVVVSDTGALLEATGTLGLCASPYDTVTLAACLDRALTDDAHRQRVAREGPVWAKRHSWDRTAEGILDACTTARR